MGAYGDYLKAARESGNPEQFVKQYVSPVEQSVVKGLETTPAQQPHNVAPVNNKLANYVAPKATVNNASEYYKAGQKARADGTIQFGNSGTFGTKPKAAPVFEDLIKDAPSADEVDNAAMKSHQYYRTQVESMLGHPVNALSDEQVKQIYIDKTGDESPYLNTGSDNPFYTPTMAAIDNAASMTSGDFPYSSQEESERTRDGSAYWDANRPEVHNAKALPYEPAKMTTPAGDVLRNGFNALFNYNGEPTAASTGRPPIEYSDEYARPNNYGYYYDGRSGNGGTNFAMNRMLEEENRKDAYSSDSYRDEFDKLQQQKAFEEAQKSASEDALMKDTYPEMQISSGYTGAPLSLDQQRFMYTDPLRTVTPGKEGGVYQTADGNYRAQQELASAYAANTYPNLTDEQAYNLDRGAAMNSAQRATLRDRTITSSKLYQDAKNRGLTPDQRNQALYYQLAQQGMTKDQILQQLQDGEFDFMSPEEAMRFYYYVDNQ